MADIADLLGKSSIDTDYAIATTVKTARLAGVLVLEAFDLSKFAVDTPVYFITYKKTTNPLTGAASVTDLVSWKALVNAGANTLTNMTVAPGYTDIGNDVGDFIECIPTSYWENSLIENIQGHANPDGTLIPSAIYSALGIGAESFNGWNLMGTTISAVAANGNRSYNLTSSADMTTVLSPGMRLRTTRTVAAPTQCTSLNGTTQYYSCPSATVAADMTFTDDFVAGAWVKLSAYQVSAVISRVDATTVANGWELQIGSDGRVALIGRNAGNANFSFVQSYQSLPLNKWVFVAAQLDMSSFTASTTTSYIMFDGVDVPCTVSRAGTNPTALVQSGNLNIGAIAGGAEFFPGKIAQPFVSSAKITQANIKTLYSQGLTPALITANSIISAYSFDNAITDLNTTSANNLTANGSAVATNADSPFGGQADGTISSTLDHAIIQKVTASTITVQVAEGCTIPTSGGVSSLSYATVKSPYGFPVREDKWELEVLIRNNVAMNVGVISTEYSSQLAIVAPLGSWCLDWYAAGTYASTNPGTNEGRYYVEDSSGAGIKGMQIWGVTPSLTGGYFSGGATCPVTVTAATETFTSKYMMTAYGGGAAFMALRGDVFPAVMRLRNAYL